MPITTCVFDAYGTLFDVAAAARVAAEQPGQEQLAAVWSKLATDWRAKQLQYTWHRVITEDHVTFWQVTMDALDWAMEASELNDTVLRQKLLDLYWNLQAYPEVPDMLKNLKEAGLATAILSNGSPDMLDAAVQSAGLGDKLNAVLSVEDVGVFKPATPVYDLVGKRFGCDKSQILFVSSNGWDAAKSGQYGFHTAWVNRANDPVDRLPKQPHHILPDLSDIPDLAKRL